MEFAYFSRIKGHLKKSLGINHSQALAIFLRIVLEKMHAVWQRKVFVEWVCDLLINLGRYFELG